MLKHNTHIGIVMIVLFTLFTGCNKDNPVDPKDTHNEAEGVTLKVDGSNLVVVREGKVQQGEISVKAEAQTNTIQVTFLDPDGDEFTPMEEGSYLGLTVANSEIAETDDVSDKPWEFVVKGKKAGETNLTIKLMHGDHADFTTPPIPVKVSQ